jgi:hypothetical protein
VLINQEKVKDIGKRIAIKIGSINRKERNKKKDCNDNKVE